MCEVKSKAKAFPHFQVDPVLKIDASFRRSLDLCALQLFSHKFSSDVDSFIQK